MEILQIAGFAPHEPNIAIDHTDRDPKAEFADLLGPERAKSTVSAMGKAAFRRAESAGLGCRRSLHRSGVALSNTACVILLSSILFIGIAEAQLPRGPVVNGYQLQPTQEQLESTRGIETAEGQRWSDHWSHPSWIASIAKSCAQ